MSILKRIFASGPDPREEWRGLWHAVVGEARDPAWYREFGVADTVEGRFDMVTLVLALVMLRLEREPGMGPATARLTELFAEDMDGQLRETGLGDPTLGKHMGRLMEVLGGRIGALRDALAQDQVALEAAAARNASLRDGENASALAGALAALAERLDALALGDLRQGRLQA